MSFSENDAIPFIINPYTIVENTDAIPCNTGHGLQERKLYPGTHAQRHRQNHQVATPERLRDGRAAVQAEGDGRSDVQRDKARREDRSHHDAGNERRTRAQPSPPFFLHVA